MPITIEKYNVESIRYVQEILLDGLYYKFNFNYNDTEGYWYISINDTEDTSILGGQSLKIVANWDLFRFCSIPGMLFCITPNDLDPTFEYFKLLYYTADEVEAAIESL